MIKLRIGGVPEHFNLPWQLALESKRFAPLGLDVEWRDYPGGSGAMAKALRQGELDAALLLTEGAVAAIAADSKFKIASLFTDSPLIWGIHVPASSRFESVAQLRGARYAISRRGSGSHLMAAVHARAQEWPVESLALVAVGTLAGAVEAFAAGTADVFFWEKFMTKPLVDSGQFRRVGEFAAPWPAFVVCVADAASREQRSALAQAVSLALGEAQALRARPDAAAVLAARYGLVTADVAEWLATTRWSARWRIASADLSSACAALNSLGVLVRAVEPVECLARDLPNPSVGSE
jgi:ABC-type nitrate/sulfonate/bicarbonate transport system substrate-binding protein